VAVIANGLGGPAAGGAAGSMTGAQSKGIGVPGGGGAGAPPCDTINGKAPVPRRGKVGSATADHPAHSNEARSLFQDGLEPEQPPPIASKIPSENIFDRQPVVDPRSTAIAVVSSVLKVAANRENGRNVLRQLLVDSLLGLARSGPRAPPMPPRSLCPTGTNRLGGGHAFVFALVVFLVFSSRPEPHTPPPGHAGGRPSSRSAGWYCQMDRSCQDNKPPLLAAGVVYQGRVIFP